MVEYSYRSLVTSGKTTPLVMMELVVTVSGVGGPGGNILQVWRHNLVLASTVLILAQFPGPRLLLQLNAHVQVLAVPRAVPCRRTPYPSVMPGFSLRRALLFLWLHVFPDPCQMPSLHSPPSSSYVSWSESTFMAFHV